MGKIFNILYNSKPMRWLLWGIALIVVLYFLAILSGNVCTKRRAPQVENMVN